MSEPHETAGILAVIASVHGQPDELPALLDLARTNGPAWREMGGRPGGLPEEERAALGRLQARLRHLLAEAQRNVEDLLVQVDRGQKLEQPAAPAAEPATLPDQRASGTGAYLATGRLGRGSDTTPERPASGQPQESRGPDRYAAAVRVAVDGQQAAIGQLTAQIVEIQRGLSAL